MKKMDYNLQKTATSSYNLQIFCICTKKKDVPCRLGEVTNREILQPELIWSGKNFRVQYIG